MNEAILKKIRENTSNDIAKMLTEVQPMPDDAFAKLLNSSVDEKDLIEQGYKPVSGTKLLWVKDESDETTA